MNNGVRINLPERLVLEDLCDYVFTPLWNGTKRVVKVLTGVKNDPDGFIKTCQLTLATAQAYWLYSGQPVNPKMEKVFDAANIQYFPLIFGLPTTLFGAVNTKAIKNSVFVTHALTSALQTQWGMTARVAEKVAIEQIAKLQNIRSPNLDAQTFKEALITNLTAIKKANQDVDKVVTNMLVTQPNVQFKIQSAWYARYFVSQLQNYVFEIVNVQTVLIYLREWGVNVASVANAIGQYSVFSFVGSLALETCCTVTTIFGYSCNLFLAIWDVVVGAENITTNDPRINEMLAEKKWERNQAFWQILVATTEIARNALTLFQIDRGIFLGWTVVTKTIGVMVVFIKVATK